MILNKRLCSLPFPALHSLIIFLCKSTDLPNSYLSPYTLKQLPPTNSLSMEFMGMLSLGIPTK